MGGEESRPVGVTPEWEGGGVGQGVGSQKGQVLDLLALSGVLMGWMA